MFLLQWYLVLVAGSVVGPIVGSKDGEVFKAFWIAPGLRLIMKLANFFNI